MQKAAKIKIEELSNQLNSALDNDCFDDALKYCNELIEIDFANSRKWNTRISDINIKKERATEQQKRWQELVRNIDSALLSEDWEKLHSICKEALKIREDYDIKIKFEKAESKLTEIRKNEQFIKTMSEINELAVRKEFDEANVKLNALEKSLKRDGGLDSNKEKQIKDTRKSLFDFGQTIPVNIPNKKKPNTKPNDFDWDFKSPSEMLGPTQKIGYSNTKDDDASLKNNHSTNSSQSHNSTQKTNNELTNDDFNF